MPVSPPVELDMAALGAFHSGFAILTTGLALRQIQTFSSESSHSVVWPVGLGSIVSGIHLLQDSLMVSSDLRFLLCSKHKSGRRENNPCVPSILSMSHPADAVAWDLVFLDRFSWLSR